MEKEINGIIEAPHTIAQIIKGTTAEFSHYKQGNLFYTVDVEGYRYEFPISTIDKISDGQFGINQGIELSADIGETSFERTYKAITLMRYIRKAIAGGVLRWDKII